MVLRLRLHQARHDGALPESLDELPPPGGAVGGVDLEAMDPFGQGRFGYLPSTGQRLVPLEDAAYQGWFFQQGNPSPRVPTDGSRLLYSVGPDRVDGTQPSSLPPRADASPRETEESTGRAAFSLTNLRGFWGPS
jgi:hypothetical protein